MNSSLRIFNIPAPVGWAAAILVAVHAYRQFLAAPAAADFLFRFAFIPVRYDDNNFIPGGAAAEVWSVFTYALLHGDVMHLAINVVWMMCFGSALAKRWGAWRFAVIFMLGAAGGAAAHYLTMPGDFVPMVGASASVSAMMAATIRFAFSPGGALAGGWGRPGSVHSAAPALADLLADRRAGTFIIVWLALNLAIGLQDVFLFSAGAAIAWQAHIGGFLTGLLLFPLLDPVLSKSANVSD